MKADDRKKICKQCPHLTHVFPEKQEVTKRHENGTFDFKIVEDKSKGLLPRCEICSCFMDVKWILPLVKCPIGKW